MYVPRAIQIVKREWKNIRLSLQMCGDIGEFDSMAGMEDIMLNFEEFNALVELDKIRDKEKKYLASKNN